ncbi:hypothetical protein, partial [Cyclobacterium roseum]|uniref:hypothetical protein n=1 Tax=Cyclobacterium roseum TaxID=2666137 RepID=UPI001F2D30DA
MTQKSLLPDAAFCTRSALRYLITAPSFSPIAFFNFRSKCPFQQMRLSEKGSLFYAAIFPEY